MTALSDEFTASSYTRTVWQTRTVGFFLTCGLVYLAVAFWLLVTAPDVGRPFLQGGAAVIFLGHAVFRFRYTPTLPMAAWQPGMRRLLAQQPWREAAVRMLDATATTLWLTGDEHVRLRTMPAAVREMVAQAEKVWVVGPDTKGRLVVRVDGLLTLWPARRIPPVDATAAQPTGRPVMELWLGSATNRWQSIMGGVLVFIGAVNLVLGVLPRTDVALAALGASFLISGVVHWVWVRRYRRLLPTSSWTRTEATAPTWRVRRNRTADGTVALDLPDGRRLTAHLTRAPLDLFAIVRQEKALWLADDTVVGFPHYPVLARAKLLPA